MRLFLFGILVTLTPSMVVAAWLLWRAEDAGDAADLNADRAN